MSQDDTLIPVDENVVSTISVESPDITNVADFPGVAAPKTKKSKRTSQRSVTKRGLLGEDEQVTSTKPLMNNDDPNPNSDIIEGPTDLPHDTSEAVVTTTSLDEPVDYDETSVQSIPDNELIQQTSTSEPSQRKSEEEADILQLLLNHSNVAN